MVKKRSTASLGRKTSDRQARKVILIVTEGETEKNYFNQLKQKLKLPSIDIEVFHKQSKNDPFGVVNYAYSLSKQRLKDNYLPYDEVFCIIDGDHSQQTNIDNYIKAKNTANKYKFQLLLSLPCFEIWFLLHFLYFTKTYQNCTEVTRDLKKYLKKYDKTIDIFEEIHEKLTIAINYAKQLDKFHLDDGCTDDINKNPSTQVHILVAQLINEKEYKGSN